MNSAGEIYPLELSRIFVEKVWGSRNLGWAVGGKLKHLPTIGELWETYDGREYGSLVLNGAHRLKPFREVIEEMGADLLGTRLASHVYRPFPLLVKCLFPSEPLSVQAHPDDEYAMAHEGGCGKTEMWIVLDTEPEAYIVLGWRPGLDKQRILEGIHAGEFERILNVVTPVPGDVYFVPPGTVHALGPGLSVLEIQQNSDLTYRLFDWNRKGADGAPRELHLERALDVLDFSVGKDYRIEPVTLDISGNEYRYLCACAHFAVCEINCSNPLSLASDPSCVWILSAISGSGLIRFGQERNLSIEAGATIAIPANMGRFIVEPATRLRLVKAWVPDLWADIVEPLRSSGIGDSTIVSLGGAGENNDISKLLS